MRWKLFVLVSVAAALVALTIWSALTIALFGSARAMARSDWRLLVSLVIPLGMTIFAAVFVYRHTSRRRKLQALITTGLTLVLTGAAYLVASTVFVSRLYIPKSYEVRHAR